MARWQCSVCGYIHVGEAPPEKCPVCGADRSLFVRLDAGPEKPAAASKSPAPAAPAERPAPSAGRRWRCTVCGYIHEGGEPPEKCPVCGADRSLFVLLPEEAPPSEPAAPETPVDTPESAPAEMPGEKPVPIGNLQLPPVWAGRVYRFHLHPIAVHIPNGLLPVSILFIWAGALFGLPALETAAFWNQVVVLFTMPLVMLSGYSDWQFRFGGHLTRVFKIKILCALLVTLLTLVLVLWRWLDPFAGAGFATGSWLYHLIGLAALAAAATAGFFGGKLVFRDEPER